MMEFLDREGIEMMPFILSIHLPDCTDIEDEWRPATVSLTRALSQKKREINAMAVTILGLKS